MANRDTPHKPNDRLRRAKSEISHNRISAETLRTEFRARFFNRLRNSRSKSVDRLRQIVEDYGDTIPYKSVRDIRKALLQDKEAANLLQTEEVNEVLNAIEKELEQIHLNKQSEDYIRSTEQETEDLVNRLLNVCQICSCMCEENICARCATELSTEFK